MAVKHYQPSAAAQQRIIEAERREREAKNLARRAKRAGVSSSVQAQREWIKANPVGFEVR